MAAPLSLADQQAINQSMPIFQSLNMGARLATGTSLSWAGRIATGHVRLAANPNDGDTLTVTAGQTTRQSAVMRGVGATLEIDTNSIVTPGNVRVPQGASAAATAQALQLALAGAVGGAVRSAVHATDTTVVDLAHTTPGGSLTLTTNAPTRLVVQSNADHQDDSDHAVYMLARTVTAEDVARTRIRVDTGLRSISNFLTVTYNASGDSTTKPYNGTITTTGGVMEATIGTAAGALVAGNILQLLILGTP